MPWLVVGMWSRHASLMLCALDASGSSAFSLICSYIWWTFVLEDRKSVEGQAKVGTSTEISSSEGSAPRMQNWWLHCQALTADARCAECHHEPQRPGMRGLHHSVDQRTVCGVLVPS